MSHIMQALLADAIRYSQASQAKRQVILTRMKRLVNSCKLQQSEVASVVGKDLMPMIFQ